MFHFAVIISILKIADSFEKGRLEQAQLSNPLNTQLYIRHTQVTSKVWCKKKVSKLRRKSYFTNSCPNLPKLGNFFDIYGI